MQPLKLALPSKPSCQLQPKKPCFQAHVFKFKKQIQAQESSFKSKNQVSSPRTKRGQRTTYTRFQRYHPRKPTPSTPKKPLKKYDGPVYVPAEVYKLLSPEAVAALKKYNTEAINKIDKKRGIHVTDIADHESPPI